MQLSNTWKATVGLMIGAILCLPAQAAAEKKIIMRYSHSSAAMVEEPHHTAALDFKKYVEEKTKGRVEVQIYPASQLGGEERAFQDVQQGVIQIASLASNNAAVFAPSLYVIDLPYLFRTNQEGWAILDKYWDELNAKTIKESGNRIIGWLPPRLQQQTAHPYHRRPQGPENPRAQQPGHDQHVPGLGL